MEPAVCRGQCGLSDRDPARSALRVDRMDANQPDERTGSRPQSPQAGARSASLEPGRSPGYPPLSSQLLPRTRGREGWGQG